MSLQKFESNKNDRFFSSGFTFPKNGSKEQKFRDFLKFVIKMIMRQKSILHESEKKQISIFHSEKDRFPFIVTVNYRICSILLYLNSIGVEFFFVLFRKEKKISGF